jgi:protein gp37
METYLGKHLIEWCTMTANPAHGCWGPGGTEKEPRRCSYCYAQRMAKRMGGMENGGGYRQLVEEGFDPFTPMYDHSVLCRLGEKLSRARKPQRVFLGSMADLGGDWDWVLPGRGTITSLGIQRLLVAFMAEHPRHTFLVLTKRPGGLADVVWPENAQVGVSVSDDAPSDLGRIEVLLDRVNAQVKWVSVEPLLTEHFVQEILDGVNWVVVGAQTGAGASSPEVGAAKEIVEYCAAEMIPCFVKANMVRVEPDFDWPMQVVK